MSCVATEPRATSVGGCVEEERMMRIPSSTSFSGINTFLPVVGDPTGPLRENIHVETLSSPVYTEMVRQAEEPVESLTADYENQADEVPFVEQQWKLGNISPTYVGIDIAARDETPKFSIQDFLQALETLNDLASMDPDDCREMLLEGNSSDRFAVLASQPQLSRLYQNIHRMQSMLRNLNIENDTQTTDLLQAHATMRAKDERIAKLETVLMKLHRRNHRLNQRSKSLRNRARKLLHQFQEIVTSRNQKDNELLAIQLQHHEQVLLRERRVSNFSEMDDLRESLPDGDSLTSIDDSLSSVTPSVYDDGIATLRISRVRTSTWPPLNLSSDSIEGAESLLNDAGYSGFNTEDPMPDECSDLSSSFSTEQPDRQNHYQSRQIAMFTGHRPFQSYTLQFLQPFELQFVALSLAALRGEAETFFAVCGYLGFDGALNVKPTLGARLLQINKMDLNPDWTVKDLEQYIRDLGPQATMTFRNENWLKDQKEVLQMAIQEHEPLNRGSGRTMPTSAFVNPFARNRSRSEPSVHQDSLRGKNVLSFLKLQGKTEMLMNHVEPDKPQRLEAYDRASSAATAKTSGSKAASDCEQGKDGLSSLQMARPSASEDLSIFEGDRNTRGSKDTSDGTIIGGPSIEFEKAMLDRPSYSAHAENPVDAAGEMIISSMKHMGKLFHFGNK